MTDWLLDLSQVLNEFETQIKPQPGNLLVVGCSTSEIIGKSIGTDGSIEVATKLFKVLNDFAKKLNLHLAIQCCEHLNRALVVERNTQEKFLLEEVSVIPVPEAGGALASIAFQLMEKPVVVESIRAHYGIDIGDTFIGMHLRPVVVPIRLSMKQVGSANVTLATTRPKLIGGERAVYK